MVARQCLTTPPNRPRRPLAATQERIEDRSPSPPTRLWLEPLRAVGADTETLYLAAPEGIRAWAERRYSA